MNNNCGIFGISLKSVMTETHVVSFSTSVFTLYYNAEHTQHNLNLQSDTKKRELFKKTEQKLKKSKKKNLLTEIEPLQLAF